MAVTCNGGKADFMNSILICSIDGIHSYSTQDEVEDARSRKKNNNVVTNVTFLVVFPVLFLIFNLHYLAVKYYTLCGHFLVDYMG